MMEGRLLAVTMVFGHKRTQVPREVAKILDVEDGDKMVWYEHDGRIYVEKVAQERTGQKVEREFTRRALGAL
ncbi:MAG: AbrB/MazE/SpoVT family DNA-binding domain-containing protein [Nitrososphaerales archaeon]|nr:AbrB/MazE/SpoVT family DNA-binding domain-containing protein [Nitrososphaerales archaeon]